MKNVWMVLFLFGFLDQGCAAAHDDRRNQMEKRNSEPLVFPGIDLALLKARGQKVEEVLAQHRSLLKALCSSPGNAEDEELQKACAETLREDPLNPSFSSFVDKMTKK